MAFVTYPLPFPSTSKTLPPRTTAANPTSSSTPTPTTIKCSLPNKNNNPPPNFSTGRLQEWSSTPGGNSQLQNQLARELQWSVQKVGSDEHLTAMLQEEIVRTSEDLAEMYDKGERHVKERNDVLVLKLSVGDIGRWNEVVREGRKVCKVMRGEIEGDLKVVEGLLKAARKKNGNGRRRDDVNGKSGGGKRKVGVLRRGGGRGASVFIGSVVLSTVGLKLFESIVKQDHGSQNLIKFGLLSSLPIILMACLSGGNDSNAPGSSSSDPSMTVSQNLVDESSFEEQS